MKAVKKLLSNWFTVLAVFAVITAACGSDSDSEPAADSDTTDTEQTDNDDSAEQDEPADDAPVED
ncbi:MAG: hypothetical protein V3V01_05325, partial [Acidimicrobiales bacterium]